MGFGYDYTPITRPYARRYATVQQTYPGDNRLWDVIFDSGKANNASMIATANKIIVPVTAYYRIQGQLFFSNPLPTETNDFLEIRFDSSTKIGIGDSKRYKSATGDMLLSASGVRRLVAGDYVTMRFEGLDSGSATTSLVATAPSPAASGTSLVVTAGQGARFVPPVSAQTATAGSATTLTDSGKSWITNQWAGRLLYISAGTGSGQFGVITSNTATVLTFPTFATPLNSTSVYIISSVVAITPASGGGTYATTEFCHVLVQSTDTLTLIRGQRGLPARTVVVGDIISLCRFDAPATDDFVQAEMFVAWDHPDDLV